MCMRMLRIAPAAAAKGSTAIVVARNGAATKSAVSGSARKHRPTAAGTVSAISMIPACAIWR